MTEGEAQYNLNFHNKVAQLSLDFFNKLPRTGKPTSSEFTVLASIIKEDKLVNGFEIVSLGTGTKCIGRNRMSAKGDILNDSHAEIICRRAFLRYLYREINLCVEERSSIFSFDVQVKRFRLKEGIHFHFFTSHVPCGDAAIFPKRSYDKVGSSLCELHGTVAVSNKNSGPSKRLLKDRCEIWSKCPRLEEDVCVDIYRTGAKCLPNDTERDVFSEGSDYHTVGLVRTKPGRGDPTLSVSCSDKIARWCFLGIQGTLLSSLLEKPIYLASFTIAGEALCSIEALRRAFDTRFDEIILNVPYKQTRMILGQSTDTFQYNQVENQQPCPSSIIWCKTFNRPLEIAVKGKKQGVTKKKRDSKSGRVQICKAELFRCYLDIAKRALGTDLSSLSYKSAKLNSKQYLEAWSQVKTKCFKVWTRKDCELLEFYID